LANIKEINRLRVRRPTGRRTGKRADWRRDGSKRPFPDGDRQHAV